MVFLGGFEESCGFSEEVRSFLDPPALQSGILTPSTGVGMIRVRYYSLKGSISMR